MDQRFFDNRLFRGLSVECAKGLDIPIEECRVRQDEIVFEEGDPGDHLYLVLEGRVQISKKGRGGNQETLLVQSEGEFFGEMAVLDGDRRSARATAVSPAVLGRIDREGLEKFLSVSPETARQFAKLVAGQLRSANSVFIDKLIQTERLSLLGTMMTGIVHDIRNPIATLGMMSQYLRNREEADLVELGNISKDSIDRIKSMIQDLLDYSRGENRMDLKPVTVFDLMDKLDSSILRRVEGSGIIVVREIAYYGQIMIDFARFQRLLENVIRNAWEAMKREGQLTIRVSGKDGEEVEFRIEDTGCGIPPEILAVVFEPFVTHGKSNGTGIGMAIAKSVVEAHQGKIQIESEVGRGTNCIITLPRNPTVAPVL